MEDSVARFNEYAADGEDPDFGRNSYAYDRFIGEIGPLGDGPYYAVRVLPGCLSTKGGPRTDADGRVLADHDGEPIPGLYAAGNAGRSFRSGISRSRWHAGAGADVRPAGRRRRRCGLIRG